MSSEGLMLVEQGLALLDALNGDGGEFWEAYAERVLPQPAALSVPFCLGEALLAELQHSDIISGASKQQVQCLQAGFVSDPLSFRVHHL